MLAAHLRRAADPDRALTVLMGGKALRVETDSQELAEYLRGYFAPFLGAEDCAPDAVITALDIPAPSFPYEFKVKQPDPGKTKIKEEYLDLPDGRVVRKRLTGMVFIFGGEDHLAVGPCLENPNQVVNFVNNRFIQFKLHEGCILGHAAGVALHGRGLGMAGFSGAGKSTLALHCLSRGADFISNDRLMVERQGEPPVMYGVAKHPRINPGTALSIPDLKGLLTDEEREEFGSLQKDELWNLEHKYDAVIEDCFGPDRFRLTAPMHGLVLLNWRPGGGELAMRRIDPVERRDLLPAFMKGTGLFFLPDGYKEPSEEDYAKALSGCTVVEMSGGAGFAAASEACMAFLETGDFPEAGA
jgi:HprK-related kinase B